MIAMALNGSGEPVTNLFEKAVDFATGRSARWISSRRTSGSTLRLSRAMPRRPAVGRSSRQRWRRAMWPRPCGSPANGFPRTERARFLARFPFPAGYGATRPGSAPFALETASAVGHRRRTPLRRRRRRGREAEGTRLLNEHTRKGYHGFESHRLRHSPLKKALSEENRVATDG